MLFNNSVSLYHYNDSRSEWSRSFIPSASVFMRFGAAVGGEDSFPENYCVVRLPISSSLKVSPSDYIYIGNLEDPAPDRALCLRVVSVTRSPRGLNPHIKLVCK